MDARAEPADAHETATTASALLHELVETVATDRITIGELLAHLESRAVGLFLLLLALPMCIPNVPGISTPFGFLMIAPSMQLIFGKGRVWLPRSLARVSIERDSLRKIVNAATPVLKRIEALLRPRWCFLTAPPFTIFFGVQVLMMALILIAPIAGGNWPPGIAVATLALALLQRDGFAAILSTIFSISSIAFIYALYYYGVRIFTDAYQFLAGLF